MRHAHGLSVLLIYHYLRHGIPGSFHPAFSWIDAESARFAHGRLLMKKLRDERAWKLAWLSGRLSTSSNGCEVVKAWTYPEFWSVPPSLRSRVVILSNEGSLLWKHASVVGGAYALIIKEPRRKRVISSHYPVLADPLTWRLGEISLKGLTLKWIKG